MPQGIRCGTALVTACWVSCEWLALLSGMTLPQMSHRGVAGRIAGALLPLALLAVALALLVPSEAVAARGDLVLVVLVVLTALGIPTAERWGLRARWRELVVLSLAPFVVLVPLASAISLLCESPVREGVLTLGLSSTEVAAVGLVALAAGDAALALGALAGSLVGAATLGPLLVGVLAADAAGADRVRNAVSSLEGVQEGRRLRRGRGP